MNETRRFLVLSTGHSGTMWLSKALNSHKEVMCFHEIEYLSTCPAGFSRRSLLSRMRRHPPGLHRPYFEISDQEIQSNVQYLFADSQHYGQAYQALGSVSTSERTVPENGDRASFRLGSSCSEADVFVLLRDPVLFVHSQTRALHELYQSLDSTTRRRFVKYHARSSESLARQLDLPNDPWRVQIGPSDKFFAWAVLRYAHLLSLSQRLGESNTFTLETLAEGGLALTKALERVAGVPYELRADDFQMRVNVKHRSHDPLAIARSWEDSRRAELARALAPWMQRLESLGYASTVRELDPSARKA